MVFIFPLKQNKHRFQCLILLSKQACWQHFKESKCFVYIYCNQKHTSIYCHSINTIDRLLQIWNKIKEAVTITVTASWHTPPPIEVGASRSSTATRTVGASYPRVSHGYDRFVRKTDFALFILDWLRVIEVYLSESLIIEEWLPLIHSPFIILCITAWFSLYCNTGSFQFYLNLL